MVQTIKRSVTTLKERVLNAASRVFSEYSYVKASMKIIAGAANISISGLYFCFNNKEDIYLTLMKTRLDDFSAKTMERDIIILQVQEHGLGFGIDIERELFKRQRSFIENIIRQDMQSGKFTKCKRTGSSRNNF